MNHLSMNAGLTGLFLLIGCSKAAPEKPVDPVALAGVAPVADGIVVETATLYGAVENNATSRVGLTSPAEAMVVSIATPIGTAVRQGQVVARLSPSPTTRLDLAKAQGDAQLASAAAARAGRLRADGLVGNAEVEAARAAQSAASATLASLAVRNRGLVLRAPASGFVETITPAPGDLVASGSPVATIIRSGDLRAKFGIDPGLARRVGRGANLLIVPNGGDTPFSAPVLSVDPRVDPQTRLASLYTAIPAETGIGAGETLSTQLRVRASTNGLTVPYAAILDDGGQAYVFVVAGGIARRHDVLLGVETGDRIAVTRGLKRGDMVVTAGGTAIEDGMHVRTK